MIYPDVFLLKYTSPRYRLECDGLEDDIHQSKGQDVEDPSYV